MKERNHFLDFLKGILSVFVILLHYEWQHGENNSLVFVFLINFSVPMFFYISGYLSALSYERMGFKTFGDAYSAKNLLKKMLRLAIPFTIAFILEWILFRINGLFIVNVFEYGILAFVKDWICGGYGMGSYYFPVMIQFIFLFPVIFFIIKKNGRYGLITVFVLNGIYELLKYAYGMNEGEYRLLVFRYLFVAAAGCYMALNRGEKRRVWTEALQLLTGVMFIIVITYIGYLPKVITFWAGTSFLACLYIVPIMNLMTDSLKPKIRFYPIELAGKASFDIFLTQMIFYCVYKDKLKALVTNYYLNILITVLIIICTGLIFYFIEKRIEDYCFRLLQSRKIV